MNDTRQLDQINQKIDKDLKIKDIDPKDSVDWSDLLGSVFGWRRDITARLALDGLISLWHPALR